jgi:hypothetical protein
MPDLGLRARVERLLRREFRPDDLTRLFLYARDRCDGRESVQEIGDFVAHHDERTKGLVTRTTRDWYVTARFASLSFAGAPIDWNRLPSNFPVVLQASYRRAPALFFKEVLRMSRADVGRLLPMIALKFVRDADGTLAVSASHSNTEFKVMNDLSAVVFGKPAFDSSRLFADFVATIRSHGLLQKSEEREFAGLNPFITLFAVSIMHNSVIRMEDSEPIRLAIYPNIPRIGVSAQVRTPNLPDNRTVIMSTPIFSTDLNAEDHCAKELLELPYPWECYVEVTQNALLERLG